MTKAIVWVASSLPALWWTGQYLTGRIVYGEYIHHTGLLALQLVVLALAITPVSRWLPNARLRSGLLRHRRAIGVASFAYLTLHAVAYLWRQPWSRVLAEGVTPAYLTAWVGLVIMGLLAATSNNASVRRLGRRWKQLHRSVYAAAALAFAHWVLTAFDPRAAYGWLIALLVIEASRWVPTRGARASG